MKFGTLSAIVVLVTFQFVSFRAVAQSPEVRAGARSAAESGYEAYEAGQFEKSLDYFTRAEDLVHAPPHLLYIARSNNELGNLVAAREAYLKIVREELDAKAPAVFVEAKKDAGKELNELEPRVPSVNVTVRGAKDDPVEVYLNGQLVPAALVGIPRPIDPGDHQVEAKSVGLASELKTVHIKEGEKLEVLLELFPAEMPPGALEDSGTPGQERDGEVSWTSPLAIGGYAALALGAGGVTLGAVFLSKSLGSQSKADDVYVCNPGCSTGEIAEIKRYESDANSQSTVGVVGLAVGGAALATGVTLLILNASKKEPAQTAAIQPWVGWGFAGINGVF
jgi:hypothetical protein